MVIAAANDAHSLQAALDAWRQGLVEPILVGSPDAIRANAALLGEDISPIRVIQADSPEIAAAAAVRLAHDGEAELVMKGLVSTKTLVRCVLSAEFGLRRAGIMSHVTLMESPDRDRLMIMTDSAINIRPTFHRKAEILSNAVAAAHKLGIEEPKAAIIAAVENVELPAMPATLDAALLKRLAAAGKFGRCVVDGPLSMDNALEAETADIKGVKAEVAGRADVLLVPDIETGNAVYKAVRHIAKRELAGAVVGASVPLVMTSRGDSSLTKLYSIALGAVLSAE